MQTLTRIDSVVIGDWYHMTTMDENINQMKLTHLLSTFPLKLKGPFNTSLIENYAQEEHSQIGCSSFD
jgi:hypothetical protein